MKEQNLHVFFKTFFYCFSFFFIVLLYQDSVLAQRLNYGEIFEQQDGLTKERAFYRFLKFQEHDPYFANTYVQLGNLSENIMRELDPLREFQSLQSWASNAVLYYQLFSVYLDGNEVRRNRELYANLDIPVSGRRLSEEDVLEYIQGRIESVQGFKDSVSLVYDVFESSKDQYNNAVRIFNQINNDYDNLKEVFLQTDKHLLTMIDSLERAFFSCINYFDQYQSLIAVYPIADYNQQYAKVPVHTFRLDGLTNSDFLLDTFSVWNYGDWVAQFRKTYETDILTLRHEIESIHNTFQTNKQAIISLTDVVADVDFGSFDPFFLYRLGVYDSNSLLRELFNYLESRQSFLLMYKNPLVSPEDTSAVLMNRKLRHYYRWAMQVNQSDEMLEAFYAGIDESRVQRHKEFFTTNYGGIQGLRVFYSEQKQFLMNTFNDGLDKLHSYFQNIEYHRSRPLFTIGEEDLKIPLFIGQVSLDNEQQYYFANEVYYDQDTPRYSAGFMAGSGGNVGYIAKINDSKEIVWVRSFESNGLNAENSSAEVVTIDVYEGGVMAMLLSEDIFIDDSDYLATKLASSKLLHLNNEGRELINVVVANNMVPLFLSYDEINQISRMALGQSIEGENYLYDNVHIALADSTGNILWNIPLNMTGNVADIIMAENKYVAIVNFKEFQHRLYPGFSYSSDKWAFAAVEISMDGRVLNITPHELPHNSIYVDKIFGISSDEINLLGYLGQPKEEQNQMKYFVISTEGEMIFQNKR